MPALPFVLKRSDDVVSGSKVTSTSERIDGLLRTEGEELVVQWRLARKTDHIGHASVRTDREFEAVREVRIPLQGIAGAVVRRRSWWLGRRTEVVLTAADLRAFEEITGQTGMKLEHPAALTLPVARSHALAALEFAADLNLLLAEREQAAVHQLRSPATPQLPVPKETR